jgi:hypothetical protein
MDPTNEQLRTFYRLVRQAVLMSSYIAFVELGEDRNLYLHVGRYDPGTIFVITINPSGEYDR